MEEFHPHSNIGLQRCAIHMLKVPQGRAYLQECSLVCETTSSSKGSKGSYAFCTVFYYCIDSTGKYSLGDGRRFESDVILKHSLSSIPAYDAIQGCHCNCLIIMNTSSLLLYFLCFNLFPCTAPDICIYTVLSLYNLSKLTLITSIPMHHIHLRLL